MELRSLDPRSVLTQLDLRHQGLEAVAAADARGDRTGALAALLEYYRRRHPLPLAESAAGPLARPAGTPGTGRFAAQLDTADKVARHIFQWGPLEEADYGPEVDWEWDPRGDIEWVASVYRFAWAVPLADAYDATGDEKYAAAFVELTADWIAKHRLENHERTHPVYTYWHGFAWLDIQTGIRATNLSRAFRSLVHGAAFTPEFLGLLLASVYDHQVKTERLPMGKVHNKAVFEQRGFINLAHTFPEFRDAWRWLELGLARTRDNLLAQTTSDGVQREWSFGYHLSVLRDAVEILGRMDAAGIVVPADYRERVRRMYDYIFAVATPDLAAPMFGDAGRPRQPAARRSQLPLHDVLVEATAILGDPKYAARARLEQAALPQHGSFAFAEAGMYVMRDGWGPEQIHLGLHCSPPAVSGHDQPDNGTFELYAYGRWLMPDSGFYIYGQGRPDREWHRQTAVHQTLTENGANSDDAARHMLWTSTDNLDALVVENQSYPHLAHRRTVWFVDRRWFVLLDEAIGEARGDLDLHFQLAPGAVSFDARGCRAWTSFHDANVLVHTVAAEPPVRADEQGWMAWEYGHRVPRPAFRVRLPRGAAPAFVTVLAPYRGSESPATAAAMPAGFVPGADRVELQVSVHAATRTVGRDLSSGEAWAIPP